MINPYYQSVVVEVTEDLICALFPNQCVSHQEAVDFVKDIVQDAKDHAKTVEIGGGTTIHGIKVSEGALQLIYDWIWFRY